jgi:hypothetical protein
MPNSTIIASFTITTKTKRDANIHEQGGRGGGHGLGYGDHGLRGGNCRYPSPGRGSDSSSSLPRADLVYAAVTGPNMVMTFNMIFQPE